MSGSFEESIAVVRALSEHRMTVDRVLAARARRTPARPAAARAVPDIDSGGTWQQREEAARGVARAAMESGLLRATGSTAENFRIESKRRLFNY